MRKLLRKAEHSVELGDHAAAEKYCKEYLSLNPSDKEGLRLLAFVYALARSHDEAIAFATQVIQLSADKPEPSDYTDRGRWRLAIGDYIGACADFSEVVALSERYKDEYYLEAAYMHRAISLARQGMVSAAEKDLEFVSDDCEVFALGELISKAALLERLR